MRGTVAKKMRREAYKEDESPRFREYTQTKTKLRKKIVKCRARDASKSLSGMVFNGCPFIRETIIKGGIIIHADKKRRFYKFAKKLYKAGEWENWKAMIQKKFPHIRPLNSVN